MYDYKSKQSNIAMLNERLLNKTLAMFEWENLPFPKLEFEKLLQKNGSCVVFKHDDVFYCSSYGNSGEIDFYGNHTKAIITNHLFTKEVTFGDDAILVRNDFLKIGLMPLLNHYHSLLIDNEINMVMYGYSSRTPIILSASDDRTKQSAELFIKKLINGELSVIGENPVFDGVKSLQLNNSTNQLKSMIELHQYHKANLYHEIGLNANAIMKKERLVSDEVAVNDESTYPYLYNMLENRLNFCEEFKEIFGIDIKVDFGSVWKAKAVENVDNIVVPSDEPLDEPLDEPSDEPLDEPSDEPSDYENDLIDEMLKDGNLTDEEKEILQGMKK